MKNIYLIVGKSGSGKTTLVEGLERAYDLKSIPSYTTRPMRHPCEIGHVFITNEEFDCLRNVCAFTVYNGYKYGATSEQVDNHDLYIIDPKGVDYFIENYIGDKTPIIIYIDVPKDVRLARMIARGDTYEMANERIIYDDLAFHDMEERADYVFQNDDLDIDTAITLLGEFIMACEEL